MPGGHEEITRFWWVVGGLFGDVVPARAIGVVPVAGEGFAQDRIQRLFHASAIDDHVKIELLCFIGIEYGSGDVRRFDVPPTQIESNHRNKALKRVIDCGHREESLGVCHEAVRRACQLLQIKYKCKRE